MVREAAQPGSGGGGGLKGLTFAVGSDTKGGLFRASREVRDGNGDVEAVLLLQL